MVREIAAASTQQSQGIDQVNTAVGQMDKVTQSSAANAEESAAAAEQLSAQAEQMAAMVRELLVLVEGKSDAPARQTNTAQRSRSVRSTAKKVSAMQSANKETAG
jgi:methyl-accepting chemotaxis protein